MVYEVRALWEDAAASRGGNGRPRLRYRATRLAEAYALRRADAVTTICEGMRGEVIACCVPADKITVIPNAVDRDTFRGPGAPDRSPARSFGLCGKPCWVFLARSTPMKGWICWCARFRVAEASPRDRRPSRRRRAGGKQLALARELELGDGVIRGLPAPASGALR
jgi:glycosyltransferase involved in cell wall biosynthesis